MQTKDFISLDHLESDELQQLLDLSATAKRHPARFAGALTGQTLAMIFQKPSTRTRVSFQAGMIQLGGHGLVLGQSELQLGRGETVADTARVLSRYVDGIMARVFAHRDIEQMAEAATVPVINGLSDHLHPCQAVADYLTLSERFGNLRGLSLVYLGDGNNVAHSLAYGAARLGVHLTIATPHGYAPDADVIDAANRTGQATGATISVSHDPDQAVVGAQALYTDVWASMGQESEHAERLRVFADFQVNAKLFSRAAPDAVFLHCLPAHRGEEVTDEIADHPRSAIFDQAENRLHAQKALLLLLLGR